MPSDKSTRETSTYSNKKRGAKGTDAAREHGHMARTLALILALEPASKRARAINRHANNLGGAIGNTSTVDFRPEVMLAELFADFDGCAFDLDGQDRARGERAYEHLRRLAGMAEEYAVALRVADLYDAELSKPGNGQLYLVELADDVMGASPEGLNPNPDSKLFTFIFVSAVQEIGHDHASYARLKDVIAKVDAGAELADLAPEYDRLGLPAATKKPGPALDSPEPKDKTSEAWRLWKLRQYEYAFTGDGRTPEQYAAAWQEFRELLTGLINRHDFWHVDHATRLLPDVLTIWQEIEVSDRYQRRSQAGMQGAETRRRNAAKKGGGR